MINRMSALVAALGLALAVALTATGPIEAG